MNSKTICLFSPTMKYWSPFQPSGSTERVHYSLAAGLRERGYTVDVVSDFDHDVSRYDVVISQEAEIFEQAKGRTIWWCQHFHDQPIIQRNVVYARAMNSQVVVLSAAHRQDFNLRLKLKPRVIPNFITSWVEPEPKRPHSFLYAAAPFKGLMSLARIWPHVKRMYPNATLDVCASMSLYGQSGDADYIEPLRALEAHGAIVHGALPQQKLFQLMARTKVFLFPSDFAETYATVLDEAHAHGMVSVVSGLGALPERGMFVVPDGSAPIDWMPSINQALTCRQKGSYSTLEDVLPEWEAQIA
jgi:glycosyltransferase involved in cell wall biosynthesis